jgi:hypothetical protein
MYVKSGLMIISASSGGVGNFVSYCDSCNLPPALTRRRVGIMCNCHREFFWQGEGLGLSGSGACPRGGGIGPCPRPAAMPAKRLENRAVWGLGRGGA